MSNKLTIEELDKMVLSYLDKSKEQGQGSDLLSRLMAKTRPKSEAEPKEQT